LATLVQPDQAQRRQVGTPVEVRLSALDVPKGATGKGGGKIRMSLSMVD
jgi:hypothetical protein